MPPQIMRVSGHSCPPQVRCPLTGSLGDRPVLGAVAHQGWVLCLLGDASPPGTPHCSPFTCFQSLAFVNKSLQALSHESLCRHGFLFPLSRGLGLEFLGLVGNSCLNFQRKTGLQRSCLPLRSHPTPAGVS